MAETEAGADLGGRGRAGMMLKNLALHQGPKGLLSGDARWVTDMRPMLR